MKAHLAEMVGDDARGQGLDAVDVATSATVEALRRRVRTLVDLLAAAGRVPKPKKPSRSSVQCYPV